MSCRCTHCGRFISGRPVRVRFGPARLVFCSSDHRYVWQKAHACCGICHSIIPARTRYWVWASASVRIRFCSREHLEQWLAANREP